MGFGWLIVGYFMVHIMAVNSTFSVAMLLGYPLMIAGLFRLAPYQKRLFYAFCFSFLSLPFAVYFALLGLHNVGLFVGLSIFEGAFFDTVQMLYIIFSFAFHTLVLSGIAALAAELGLYDTQRIALRNLTFMAIYCVLHHIISMPLAFFEKHGALFALSVTLIRFLCAFLNIWLFFRCYRYIEPEGADGGMLPTDEEEEIEEEEQV